MSGVTTIDRTFENLKAAGRAAFMPYCTLGFPDYEASLRVIEGVAKAGADLMELGVPFSDPLADGPVIQNSTQVALNNGMSVTRCFDAVRELRSRGITQPFMLMGYINPILAYGCAEYARDAAKAGADGLIVPDLPVEESEALASACDNEGLALVFLVPPNTSDERIQFVASRSKGFLYLVSLSGVTGERTSLAQGLSSFISRARLGTKLPLAVGFGISNPEQAKQVGEIAEGVIVGSALVKVVEKAQSEGTDPAKAASDFTRSMREALGA